MGDGTVRIEEIGARQIAGIEDGTWTLAGEGASVGRAASGAGKSVWLELIEQTRDVCLDRHWGEDGPDGKGWWSGGQAGRGRGPEGLARAGTEPSAVTVQWRVGDAQWRLEWEWRGREVAGERLWTRAEGARRWRTALERNTARESTRWRIAQWVKKAAALRRATRADALVSATASRIGAPPMGDAITALASAVRSAQTTPEGAAQSTAACAESTARERLVTWMNRHGAVQIETVWVRHGALIVKRVGADPEAGMAAMPRSVRWLWSLAAQWIEALDARAVMVLDDIDAHIDARTRAGLIEEAHAHGVQLIATARGESRGVVVETR